MKILKRFNNKIIKSFKANEESLPELLDYIRECFPSENVNKHVADEYQLIMEEVIVKLIKNASDNSLITVESLLEPQKINIKLRCPGKRVNLYKEDEEDIGGTLIEDYSDYLKQSYSAGTNQVVFYASSASANLFIKSISAFVASALIALVISLVFKEEQIEFISNDVIIPIIYFFLGVLKALATPMVFFSIATLINRLNLKFENNKNTFKTFIRYVITATVSALIGFTVIGVVHHYFKLNDYTPYIVEDNLLSEITFKSFIQQFIFEDIVDPIEASNPIPMIALAVILGIASSSIYGRNGDSIRQGISSFRTLFRQMFNIAYSTIPIFLVFSMIIYWLDDPVNTILSIIDMFLQFVPGTILLTLVYAIELMMHHISPIDFLKEYKDVLINNLKIGSNIEAYPYNKRIFTKKFKNTKDVNETLQLGESVSMDGTAMVAAGYALYLACSVNLEPTPGIVISLFGIIMMSAVGSPNDPGSLILIGVVVMNYLGLSDAVAFELIIYEVVIGVLYSYLNSISDIVNIVCENSDRKKRIN